MTSATPCPSCGADMDHQRFARRVHGDVALDVCWNCHAIWFDQYESAQLAPAAVMALFRLIHEHRAQSPRALADTLRCPRCGTMLELTHDMQRNNRLRYHRCTDGHGRLTTFMQFLREKEFVRSLSPPEIESLKATISQVRCSSCGATVDLERDVACSYCRAPLAVLDSAAVEKALAALTETEKTQTRAAPSPTAAAFESLLAAHRLQAQPNWWMREVSATPPSPHAMDLVVAGLALLFDA
ncbi:MAG: zf-TFIIB domain-containing protein [Gemmatimonas sp.]